MQKTLALFPFAKQTNDNIEKQNKFLRKISLTGKINALDFSANLFVYTDETILKFTALKEELINALVEESVHKITNELRLKAQLSIDVLNRNLFERTADVGFLATDGEIVQFLQDANYPRQQIESRLTKYVEKYSVYEDVLLYDTQGNLKANLKSGVKDKTDGILIKQALQAQDYIELYAQSDILPHNNKALIYAHKVETDGQAIGVLCLVFKFDDELKTIFNTLAQKEDLLALEDTSGIIASTNTIQLSPASHIMLSKHHDLTLYKNDKIAIQAKTNGYQGYKGLAWKMTAIDIPHKEENAETFSKQSLAPKLKKIIDNAHEIVDDLGDVIINGELIASKYKQYTLSPILENLRIISTTLLHDINNAAENLANTKTSARIASAKLSTIFAMDIMDRNLYERANDSRWWALTPSFIQTLKSSTPDANALNETLKQINDLYTVYTNIFIYDKNGMIIAASKDQSIIGSTINTESATRTLHNKNPQHYFVSAFTPTPYYHDKPSYLYHASIVADKQTVGGIALVFDANVEFQAILEASMPENTEGFFLFCDAQKTIISSSSPKFGILDTLDIQGLPLFSRENIVQEFIRFEEKNYLITIVPSKGYREYKTADNYQNDVYALSLIAL